MALPRVFLRQIRYGGARTPSTSLPAGQTFGFHAPDQEVDAVLAEERLLLEHEGRHAPMAGGGVVLFVVGYYRFQLVGVRLDRLVHRGEVEASRFRRAGEMAPLAPARDRAAPQTRCDRVNELKRAALRLCQRAEPRDAMDVG